MKIIDALKRMNARVSHDSRWLVWNVADEWVVYEHRYGAKRVDVICVTDNEEIAVEALLYDEATDGLV